MPSGDTERLDDVGHVRDQLQLLADISAPAVAYLDTDRRFEITNAAFKSRFGEPPPNTQASDFFEGVCSPAVDEYLENAIRERHALRAQLDCTGHDGNTDRLRLRAIPQIVADEVVGVFLSFDDNEPRQLPKEGAGNADLSHDELRDHLERMARLGEMTAGLTHEIRQPLAAIINYAGVLKRHLRHHPSSDSIVGLVDRIVEQTNRADHIVASARSMVGKGKTTRVAFDIADVIDDCMTIVERRARQMDVDIRIGMPAELGKLHGNPHQIEQILMNLVNNALDAMADQPKRVLSVDVGRARDANDQTRLLIRIGDTGPGIAPEQRGSLFKAMQTSKYDGMGMGLSISRKLAEQHEGTLRAEAETQEGAVFVLELPLDDA